MPAFPMQTGSYGVPNTPLPGTLVRSFAAVIFPEMNYVLTGISRDSGGAALGSCVVKVYDSITDLVVAQAVSNASGNYSFVLDKTKTYYIVAYKASIPASGTTLNTLVPV